MPSINFKKLYGGIMVKCLAHIYFEKWVFRIFENTVDYLDSLCTHNPRQPTAILIGNYGNYGNIIRIGGRVKLGKPYGRDFQERNIYILQAFQSRK